MLFCLWDSPGKNPRVGCHALLKGIFLTQEWNPGLPHGRWILYCLSHQGSPFRASSLISSPAQALESAEKKIQERKQEQEDNLAEISNMLRGDLLSENPQQAASSFGPHRVVPDRWKGMSQEQLEEIRLVQKHQVQEKLVPVPSPFPKPSAPTVLSTTTPLHRPQPSDMALCSLPPSGSI